MDAVRLKEEFVNSVNEVVPMFIEFPWADKAAYSQWLAQTFYFVRHTTSFLSLSAARYGFKNRTEQYHCFQHLKEEKDHDLLLLKDLENLGCKIEDFEEAPETMSFYQSQYYLIEHVSPSAHLGYALFLEGMASKACKPAYDIVKSAFGASAGQFLKIHALVDDGHFEHGCKDLVHLSQNEITYCYDSLRQTRVMYRNFLMQILQKYLSASTAA